VEEDKTEVQGFEQKLEAAVQGLASALGIELPLAQKIASVGFSTAEAIAEATEADLAEAVPDLTPEQPRRFALRPRRPSQPPRPEAPSLARHGPLVH
ncbi:MAG: hypothetical protein EBZ78_11235, partial [Verrucomicrobia bacterium]|nr:hypothetical protein [Verrucomicrobiota bacterium]